MKRHWNLRPRLSRQLSRQLFRHRSTHLSSRLSTRLSRRLSRHLGTILRLQVLLAAPVAYAADLNVTIGNIESDQGRLMIAIVASEAAFNGSGAPALSVSLPARRGSVSFSTDALPAGTYGIRVMHDENGNGEIDSNLVGMPTEGWGFSNNAVGNFGPPGWADVSFELGDRAEQLIDLNH